MAETNKPVQILFTAFEATPFIKTGGLGDVAGSLPPVIRTAKYDIRVILPLHSAIPENYRAKMRFIKHYNVPLSWRKQYCGLFELEHNGIIFYFLDNEYYFRRAGIYGEFDDGERVAFFSKAALETIQHIDGFKPSILHCNDWHTALVPVFLREHYMGLPDYSKIHTVFTIHNLKFQGKYSDYMIDNILGLHRTPAENQLSEGGSVNYLKGAVLYSDLITTVSPTYAAEICTPYFGEGTTDRKSVV